MFLFPRRKSNQKCAQGARPLENPQFVVYLPSAVAGLFLPKFLPFACRCPASTHRFYRGAKQRGECLRFCRAAIRRVPAADSVPLRGRQAELVESQATRSEPRRKRSFTGHRSSSLGSVSVSPPPRQVVRQRKRCLGRPRVRESRTVGSGALLVTFPAWEK